MTRVFDVPRDRVFRAWTEPAHLMGWWAPAGFTTPFCSVDLRPGGAFRYCMRSPEGRDYWGRGVYREIVEPERISYLDSFTDADGNPVPPEHYGVSSEFPSETLITVTLGAQAGRTALSLRWAMESAPAAERDMCEQGWNQMLDRLAAHLAEEGPSAQPRGEALAARFEVKTRDAVAVLGALSDADWKKVTAAEGWTVAATAHHLAGALEAVAGIITTLVSGQSPRHFTVAMLDEMNATHAVEHANCTKAETLALFEKGAPLAAAVVRGLSDAQLARSVTVFADMPPMTVEQLVIRGLIAHIDEHIGSIRTTVGR
jgi:uncharacterized protein YndB with AHSA1/START domain